MNNQRIKRPPKDIRRAKEVEFCFELEIGEDITFYTCFPGRWKSYFYAHKPQDKNFTISVVQLCSLVVGDFENNYSITVKRIENNV